MPLYKIGDRVDRIVDRIEDRPVTGATIIAIQDGTGWWPENTIKPIVTDEKIEI